MVDDKKAETATVAGAVERAETVKETYFETIQRLAVLPAHEYERCRKAEAKRLDMRTAVLDKEVRSARSNDDKENSLGLVDPDPWPEEVDGEELLDRIVGGLCRHIVMPAYVAYAVALWVVHCYVFDIWHHTPRLSVSAPEKGCGKSTLLDVL